MAIISFHCRFEGKYIREYIKIGNKSYLEKKLRKTLSGIT